MWDGTQTITAYVAPRGNKGHAPGRHQYLDGKQHSTKPVSQRCGRRCPVYWGALLDPTGQVIVVKYGKLSEGPGGFPCKLGFYELQPRLPAQVLLAEGLAEGGLQQGTAFSSGVLEQATHFSCCVHGCQPRLQKEAVL